MSRSARRSFDAVILEGGGGGAYVEVPFDVAAVYGSARPKVIATFDGLAYRGTIATMGGHFVIGVLKDIRARLDKQFGDRVRVTIEADTQPREVTVPDDMRAAMHHAGVEAGFERLSYTHRKEHVEAVEGAKRPETRARRIDKVIANLRLTKNDR